MSRLKGAQCLIAYIKVKAIPACDEKKTTKERTWQKVVADTKTFQLQQDLELGTTRISDFPSSSSFSGLKNRFHNLQADCLQCANTDNDCILEPGTCINRLSLVLPYTLFNTHLFSEQCTCKLKAFCIGKSSLQVKQPTKNK